MKANEEIDQTENPFGPVWRWIVIAVMAVVVVALGVMIWAVLTH